MALSELARRHPRAGNVTALLLGLTVFGCDDDGGRAPMGDASQITRALQRCGLVGRHVVESVTTSCATPARRTDEVLVELTPGGASLRLNDVAVPIVAVGEDCSLDAEGCRDTAPDPGSTVSWYERISARGAPTGDRWTLAVGAERIVNGELACDAETVVTLRALPPCAPEGRYVAAGAAAVVTGSCELAWDAGSVEMIRDDDGTYTLEWAGVAAIDDLALDAASCTLRGTRGVSSGTSFEIWNYDGAGRSLEVELRITEQGLEGTANDRLDGTTIDGVRCDGATFALAAERATEVAPKWSPTCSGPRPAACGDGVCEASERCDGCAADCTCGAGTACALDGMCRTACTFENASAVCAEGERCGEVLATPDMSNRRPLYPDRALSCVAAGSAAAGEPCDVHDDCGAGLVCHVPTYAADPSASRPGTCATPCTPGVGGSLRCDAGFICDPAGDGSSGTYPSAYGGCLAPCVTQTVDACEAEQSACGAPFRSGSAAEGLCVAVGEGVSDLGEPCEPAADAVQRCVAGLSCVRLCSGGECESACTKSCAGDADCPAILPVCDRGDCWFR